MTLEIYQQTMAPITQDEKKQQHRLDTSWLYTR